MLALLILGIFSLSSNCFGLENGLARTPPMGWMHWQRFRCLTDCDLYPDQCISEKLFLRQAKAMVDGGYLNAGYEYLIIDDCWLAETRDENGRLQPDPDRFPNGIKALADQIHNLGLKFGIYEDYGTKTCAGYPGSIEHLQLDAQTFAEWGVDYLKLDGCYAETENMEEGYAEMSKYLNETGRPIVFSCSFPAYKGLDANYAMAVDICNLWRNYDDIQDSWSSVTNIADWFNKNQQFLNQFSGPGHWNDPDMLLIGNFGLSFDQSISQMTIWTLMGSPLIMSVDLDTIQEPFQNILLNKVAISINQDSLGLPGNHLADDDEIHVWKRQLVEADEVKASYGLGFVSYRTDGYIYRKAFNLADYQFPDVSYVVTNVFDPDSELNGLIFTAQDEIVVHLNPTGAVLLLLEPHNTSQNQN